MINKNSAIIKAAGRAVCFLIILSLLAAFLPAFSVRAFAQVSDEELFEYLTEHASNFEKAIDISSFAKRGGWNFKTVTEKVKMFYLLSPELFFVNNENMYIEYDEKNCYYKVKFEYVYTGSRKDRMLDELRKEAAKIVSGLSDDMTDAEKVLAVHDCIVLNTSYDRSEKKRSAYNCLVEHSAVCQGYSLAFLYIVRDMLGIECSIVTSDSQNHAWNYVKIGGSWYHVDTTADDPSAVALNGEKYDSFGEVSHTNLLVSDSECAKASDLHRNWKTFGLPAARSNKYDKFFWRESRSPLVRHDGLWYYAVPDPKCSAINYKSGSDHEMVTLIRSYSFKTGRSEPLTEISSTWLLYRDASTGKKLTGISWYKRSFLKLALFGDELFYNTADEIWCLNLKSGRTKKLYTLNKKNMSIYGIAAVSGSKMRVCYKQDMSYKGKYINLTVKA